MKYTEIENKLLEGFPIRRSGWDKGMFIFRQVPANIDLDIVPKMQSLPEEVKKEFIKRGLKTINYDNQIAIVNSENRIWSWSPRIEDLFADNWELYN